MNIRTVAVALCSAFAGAAIYAFLRSDEVDQWKYWYRLGRHHENVSILVRAGSPACPEPDLPLYVEIQNRSSLKLYKVTFLLSAKKPGRSSNLVYGSPYESDRIIEPNAVSSLCARIPPLREAVEKPQEALEWSIDRRTVEFES